MKFSTDTRYAGVFVPVFAIRTEQDLGIGDGSGLMEMLQWCGSKHLRVLQILPINETSGDNSPVQRH